MRQFKIGDIVKVKSIAELERDFSKDGEGFDCGDVYFIDEMNYLCGKTITVTEDNFDGTFIEIQDKKEVWTLTPDMVHFLNDCKVDFPVEFPDSYLAKSISELYVKPQLKMRIKYFEGATKLQKITKGNWIDVFANKDVFVPLNERAMIPLGFALELPQGWEGHLAPRSSTFKTWGIIQTNSIGVVDDSYIGDNDQWHFPAYCLHHKSIMDSDGTSAGTWIRKGDKIGQFRVMEVMPEIEFEEVEAFGNEDRGGFGTTGTRQ